MTKGLYEFWLSSIPGIGCRKIQAILSVFGEPEAVFQADREALEQVAGLRTKDIDRLIVSRNREQIKRRWDSICSRDILFTCVTHPDYPAKLHHIADPPYALYYKGSLPSEHVPSVAVVGEKCEPRRDGDGKADRKRACGKRDRSCQRVGKGS